MGTTDKDRAAAALMRSALEVHAMGCEECGGPDDGCEVGQSIEFVMLDLDPDAYKAKDTPACPGCGSVPCPGAGGECPGRMKAAGGERGDADVARNWPWVVKRVEFDGHAKDVILDCNGDVLANDIGRDGTAQQIVDAVAARATVEGLAARLADVTRERDAARAEINTDNSLLATRDAFVAEVAEAVGGCENHGDTCIPHLGDRVRAVVADLMAARTALALLTGKPVEFEGRELDAATLDVLDRRARSDAFRAKHWSSLTPTDLHMLVEAARWGLARETAARAEADRLKADLAAVNADYGEANLHNIQILDERDAALRDLAAARAEGERQGIERAAEVAHEHTPFKHANVLAAHVVGSTIEAAIRALTPTASEPSATTPAGKESK